MAKMSKQDAERLRGNVPEEYVFRCCDGCVLGNMSELGDAFDSMSDETFAFHVSPVKNDFSNWVRDIIKDEKLALDLSKARSRMQAAKRVTERLAFLQNKLG